METRAIFMHSGWRSAGTWMWTRFRAHGGVRAFYEPLHDGLATLAIDGIEKACAAGWPSKHPPMAPYFEEYAPLVGRRGVRHYDKAFAVERFFLRKHEDDPALERYLHGLLTLASERGELPVLKFARSSGRIGWMRARFPIAWHVAILRDPLAQWSSCATLAAQGHPFFLSMPLALLVRYRRDERIAEIAAALRVDLARYARLGFARTHARCTEFATRSNAEESYRTYLAFWLATALESVEHADHVIDSDRLTASPSYALATAQRVRAETGLSVSLDSERDPSAQTVCPIPFSYILRANEAAARLAQERATGPYGAMLLEKLGQPLRAEAGAGTFLGVGNS